MKSVRESSRPRIGLRVLFFGVLAALHAAVAHAQAWLPPKGSFSLAVAYSNTLNKHHYTPNGEEIDRGHTRAQSISFRFAYAFTDRITLTGGIPFVRTRYDGAFAHATELDDGHAHETFTDWRLGLHYQLLEAPWALAPYFVINVPSTRYETLGHAAPGRGLEELWLGFSVGRSLDQWLPRTYLQARYNYAFVEKVAGVFHDRSNADLEFGYFVTPGWSARVVGFWQETHGGIPVPIPQTHPLFNFHDQLGAAGFLDIGVGTSLSITDSADVFALYTTSLSGRNGHKNDQGLSVGWSYQFRPR